MADITRTTRVPAVMGALVIASVLIGGAYTIANPNWLPFKPQYANAESTQEVLQAYAKKDSDGDGLPDWQEALYGTDPNNAHSVSATLTDSQAVAQGLVKPKFLSETASSSPTIDPSSIPGTVAADGTVTAQFSQSLFSNYLSQSNGAEPSSDDISTYVTNAMQDFVSNHASSDPYSLSQEKVSGTGAAVLTSYAINAERVFAENSTSANKSEIDYFADAVERNDTAALAQVVIIGKEYSAIANAYIQVPAPSEAQAAHLEMANALGRLGIDITDMGTLNSDPLRAYLGLSQYQTDQPALAKAFSDLNAVFTEDDVNIPTGPGSSFYSLVQTSAGLK